MPKKKQSEPSLAEQLQERFNRWDDLYTNGGSDPFYADGGSLNMLRNQIEYLKAAIVKAYSPDSYPEIYHRETPSEMSNDYMAMADNIRANAREALDFYFQDENYRFLLDNVDSLPSKVEKNLCVKTVIHYAQGLEKAIADNDLLTMRRHKKNDHYHESFENCADKIKAYQQTVGETQAPQSPPPSASAKTETSKSLIEKEQIIMGNETIQISFDAEKLDALQFYLAEKSLSVEKELQDCINSLYEKNVPAATRRYLERNDEPSEKTVQADAPAKKSGMTDEERTEFNRQRREQRKAAKEQAAAELTSPGESEQGDAPEIDEGEEESQGMSMSM